MLTHKSNCLAFRVKQPPHRFLLSPLLNHFSFNKRLHEHKLASEMGITRTHRDGRWMLMLSSRQTLMWHFGRSKMRRRLILFMSHVCWYLKHCSVMWQECGALTWNKASLDNIFVGPPTFIELGLNRLSCRKHRDKPMSVNEIQYILSLMMLM